MENDIQEIRIDLVWEIVFAESVKLNYRWLKILALTMSWPDFKKMMCRTKGKMKALVIRSDGRVTSYTAYDGFQIEECWQ